MRTKSSIEDLYESTILKILVKKFQCTNQQQRWGCQCNNKFNGNWCQLHRLVGKASTCLPFLLIKFVLLIQHRLLFNADSWGGILHKRGTCFWWPLEKRTSQLKPWNWVSVDSNLQSSDPCSLPPAAWPLRVPGWDKISNTWSILTRPVQTFISRTWIYVELAFLLRNGRWMNILNCIALFRKGYIF